MVLLKKGDDVAGQLGRIHNEDLYYLHSSAGAFRVIKSRRMKWAGHIARMGRQQEYTEFWWGNRMGRVYVEDLSVDAKIIFKGIIKK